VRNEETLQSLDIEILPHNRPISISFFAERRYIGEFKKIGIFLFFETVGRTCRSTLRFGDTRSGGTI